MKIQRRYHNLQQLRNLVQDNRYFTDFTTDNDASTIIQRIPDTGTTLYLLGAWFQANQGAFRVVTIRKEDLDGNLILELGASGMQGNLTQFKFELSPEKIVGGLHRATMLQDGGNEVTALWWGWTENTIRSS